ncbi:MAG: APC family permease [Acidimicrobiales bacterium]|jgi:amino acid transporter
MTALDVGASPPKGLAKLGALRRFDMILFSVAAILCLSQVPITASLGQSVIVWTIVVIFLFFLPYGLITAELGSTYPDAGGIYSWVARAFGPFWGTQVSWWYWVNVGIWLPSVYLMFSTLMGQLFGWHISFWESVIIAIALIWINFGVNVVKLETSKWVANTAAIITVTVMLVLAVAGFVHLALHGSANVWSRQTTMPTWASLGCLGVVVYNFLGFELMSSASQEMRDPKKDVPRSILTSGLLIGVFYVIAVVGILLLLPLTKITSTTGLYNGLKAGLGSAGVGHVFAFILCLGALYCFFALLIPWTIGANRAAAEAAQRGDLPRVFGHMNQRFKTPVGAAALTSIIGTTFTLAFGVIVATTGQNSSVETLFWNLFAFSSVVFMFCYLLMTAAFFKLRRKDPDTPRPYRVPGGTAGALVVTVLCLAFVSAGILFFLWADPTGPADWSFIGQMAIGLAVVAVIGVVFNHFAAHRPETPAGEHPEAGAKVVLEGLVPNTADEILEGELHKEGSR